jgi:Mitochondrial carrier protein
MTYSEDDFESLPSEYPFITHMMAGAVAGMTEHGVMFPLDTIKTRLQIINAPSAESKVFRNLSLIRAIKHVIKQEGNHSFRAITC